MSVELKGRLVADPELRYTPNGKDVCNGTIALQGGWMSKEKGACPRGWKEDYHGKGYEYTLFCRLTGWGKNATRLAGMRKGDVVHIQAKLSGDLADGVMRPRVYAGRNGAAANWEFQISWFIDDEEDPAYTLEDEMRMPIDSDDIPW
jgi:hypothetical protein